MTLMEHLEQIESQMECCFLQNRFDAFNQLASDRLVILKKAMNSPERDDLLALAREQSDRWVKLLGERVSEMRVRMTQQHTLAGYGTSKQTGRVFNRSF